MALWKDTMAPRKDGDNDDSSESCFHTREGKARIDVSELEFAKQNGTVIAAHRIREHGEALKTSIK
jgi:hypothetical protein